MTIAKELHHGNNNFTVGTTTSLWKQQLHCGNNNFTVETTTSLWEQQFHCGNNNFTVGTTISPWQRELHHTHCLPYHTCVMLLWTQIPTLSGMRRWPNCVYQLIPIFHSILVFIAAWLQLKNWHYDVMTAEDLTLWRDGSWGPDTMTKLLWLSCQGFTGEGPDQCLC